VEGGGESLELEIFELLSHSRAFLPSLLPLRADTRACTNTSIHTRTHMRVTSTCICTHTHTLKHTHTLTHTYTHTHTHTHVKICVSVMKLAFLIAVSMMFETIHMHYAYRVWMMTYRLYAIYAGRLCLNTSSISTYTHSTRSIHIHHTYEPSIYR